MVAEALSSADRALAHPGSLLRGERMSLAAQRGDAVLGIELGPVRQGKVGDLKAVVRACGNAEFLSADMDVTDAALVEQNADVFERRTLDRYEIGVIAQG